MCAVISLHNAGNHFEYSQARPEHVRQYNVLDNQKFITLNKKLNLYNNILEHQRKSWRYVPVHFIAL